MTLPDTFKFRLPDEGLEHFVHTATVADGAVKVAWDALYLKQLRNETKAKGDSIWPTVPLEQVTMWLNYGEWEIVNEKIEVGDIVEVVDAGKQYLHYLIWADAHGMKRYSWGQVNTGCTYTVFVKDFHNDFSKVQLLGIRGDDGNEYIIAEAGVKLAHKGKFNGVDADGNPKNFTVADLKPFQRVVTKAGGMFIAAPDALAVDPSSAELILVEQFGWINFHTPDNEKSKRDETVEKFAAVAVYDLPECNSDLLNLVIAGKLIWEYKEQVEEPTMDDMFATRLAYFKTHIDAVEENLTSLKREFEELKEAV